MAFSTRKKTPTVTGTVTATTSRSEAFTLADSFASLLPAALVEAVPSVAQRSPNTTLTPETFTPTRSNTPSHDVIVPPTPPTPPTVNDNVDPADLVTEFSAADAQRYGINGGVSGYSIETSSHAPYPDDHEPVQDDTELEPPEDTEPVPSGDTAADHSIEPADTEEDIVAVLPDFDPSKYFTTPSLPLSTPEPAIDTSAAHTSEPETLPAENPNTPDTPSHQPPATPQGKAAALLKELHDLGW